MKKYIEKYPIISSVIFVVLTMLLPWGLLFPLLAKLPYYYGYAIKYALTGIITVIICLLAYKKIPFPLENKNYFKGLVTFGLLGLICAFMAFFCSWQSIDRTTNASEVISFILYVAMIALSEELLFRGLILMPLLKKYAKDKNGVLLAITIASIIFGLRHFINLITKNNTYISTTGQVLFTFMAGFYLSCLYVRTKNFYIGLTIHFLEDIFTMCWALFSISFYNNQNVDGPLLNTLGLVLIHSIYVIFGILMIKDKRYEYKNIMED